MRSNQSAGKKLTYRYLLTLPDDRNRHELIDGVHYVTPPPITLHQIIVGNLYFGLRGHLERYGGGQLFVAPVDVVFTIYDVVEPDLLFISDARRRVLTAKNVQGAPDLVVEVLSPSTRRRDEGRKLDLYDASDVIEYWIVDPSAEVFRIYRRRDGQLKRAEELTNEAGAAVRSPLFPGLSLSLGRVFAK